MTHYITLGQRGRRLRRRPPAEIVPCGLRLRHARRLAALYERSDVQRCASRPSGLRCLLRCARRAPACRTARCTPHAFDAASSRSDDRVRRRIRAPAQPSLVDGSRTVVAASRPGRGLASPMVVEVDGDDRRRGALGAVPRRRSSTRSRARSAREFTLPTSTRRSGRRRPRVVGRGGGRSRQRDAVVDPIDVLRRGRSDRRAAVWSCRRRRPVAHNAAARLVRAASRGAWRASSRGSTGSTRRSQRTLRYGQHGGDRRGSRPTPADCPWRTPLSAFRSCRRDASASDHRRSCGRTPTGGSRTELGAGPNRVVRFSYWANEGDPAPVATSQVTVRVRAGVTLKTSTKRVRNGSTLRFSRAGAGRGEAARRW